ncbi:MAG: hypothetical protein LBJ76_00410 [Candidatus Accumulibacter sp.]|jgi:hypothetical protein|nr:hypothetical protein [Accumulibacter sp.]
MDIVNPVRSTAFSKFDEWRILNPEALEKEMISQVSRGAFGDKPHSEIRRGRKGPGHALACLIRLQKAWGPSLLHGFSSQTE